MLILILFAFIAGVVTVLSPCILPILPIILASSIGGVQTGKSRPLGVVSGFVLSFTFFTLFLTTIVRLSGIPTESLRLLSVLVIGGFGISLLAPKFQALVEKLFSRLASFIPNTQGRTGFGGGLLIGFSVGLLWTPCVGPILASVITLAISGSVSLDGFLITLAYALGTAIPMLLIMLGGQKALHRVPWLLSHLDMIQKLFGVLMIITAIGIYFNVDRTVQTWVITAFPRYGTGLTQIEDNQLVRNQLNKQADVVLPQNALGKPTSALTLPKGPQAPELIPGGVWFNLPTDQAGSTPLSLAALKGKVVLIDFWTYSCINCQRTLPYLRAWNEKYKDKGLVIIGVHAPEFEFEKSEKNVAQAIKDFRLTYPIMQDNNFATWRAYNNHYWPAKYFIDKDGAIRHSHFGEGEYDESERVIQELLKETGEVDISSQLDNPAYQVTARTPETYVGLERNPTKQGFTTSGNWNFTDEYAAPSKGAMLNLNFDAKEVFLVMRTNGIPARVKVYVDDTQQYYGVDNQDGVVTVTKDSLYNLVTLPEPGKHILRLEFEDDNAQAFAFTFG